MTFTFSKKKIIIAGVSIVLIGALVYFAQIWNLSRQRANLSESVRESLDVGDYEHAAMAVRRLLHVAPDDVEAMLLTAELMEQFNVKEALKWQYNAYLKRPSDFDIFSKALVNSVLCSDFKALDDILKLAEAHHMETASYWTYRGVLYSKNFDLDGAAEAFARAIEIDPDKKDTLVNLSMVRLYSKDESLRKEALESLFSFLEDEIYRERVLLQLCDFYAESHSLNKLEELVATYCMGQKLSFQLRVKALNSLYRLSSANVSIYLDDLVSIYVDDKRTLNAFLSSLNSAKQFDDAIYFASKLPQEYQLECPLAITLAETRFLMKDWKGLDEILKTADFSSYPYVKELFQLESQFNQASFGLHRYNEILAKLLYTYKDDPVVWPRLLSLSETWGMKRVALAFQLQEWESFKRKDTLKKIYSLSSDLGDMHQMYKALSLAVKADSSDVMAKNHLAYLGFVFGYNHSLLHKYAEEVLNAYPEDHRFQFTKSLSLYKQEKYVEALSLIQPLVDQDSSSARLQLFYAVYLYANGKVEEANNLCSALDKNNYMDKEWEFAKEEMRR